MHVFLRCDTTKMYLCLHVCLYFRACVCLSVSANVYVYTLCGFVWGWEAGAVEDMMNYFRAVMRSQEKSGRVLTLLEDVLQRNPANYTAWQYRREVLEEVGCDVERELEFVGDATESNPKNYQVWYVLWGCTLPSTRHSDTPCCLCCAVLCCVQEVVVMVVVVAAVRNSRLRWATLCVQHVERGEKRGGGERVCSVWLCVTACSEMNRVGV